MRRCISWKDVDIANLELELSGGWISFAVLVFGRMLQDKPFARWFHRYDAISPAVVSNVAIEGWRLAPGSSEAMMA